jgi:hypothetical protein
VRKAKRKEEGKRKEMGVRIREREITTPRYGQRESVK